MNKEVTDNYIKGYIDGMHGVTINAESELFDIYIRLRDFLEQQCNELTDNQRTIFNTILDDFDYILQTGDFNAR